MPYMIAVSLEMSDEPEFLSNKLRICKLQTIYKQENVIQSVLQTDF